MTTKELWDDYEAMCTNRYSYTDYTNEERKEYIIKELEASIRKEQLKEMRLFFATKDWHGTGKAMVEDYALSKGITLKQYDNKTSIFFYWYRCRVRVTNISYSIFINN